MHPDLTPAADTMTRLVAGVRDDQLDAQTPCEGTSVGALLDHIAGLGPAFATAAGKGDDPGPPPEASAANLATDWRTAIPAALTGLALAWQRPDAWDGMTSAGGVKLPAEVCGLVALDELVIHAWDLAVATGQEFTVDDGNLAAVHEFVEGFEPPPGGPAETGQLFGPPVAVAADASLLDRTLGKTGRDPRWAP